MLLGSGSGKRANLCYFVYLYKRTYLFLNRVLKTLRSPFEFKTFVIVCVSFFRFMWRGESLETKLLQ